MPPEYEFHEYANVFPMMTQEKFDELCKSLEKRGYLKDFPIILYQNKILDGRNRFDACKKMKVIPVFSEFTGTDDQAFDTVGVSNLTRKHWTADQLGMIALDYEAIEAMRAKERQLSTLKQNTVTDDSSVTVFEKGEAAEKAAKKVGVTRKRVQRSKAVAKKSSELAKKVKEGRITLKAAEKKIKEEEKKKEREKLAKLAKTVAFSDRWDVFQCDIRAQPILKEKLDIIITDPPYPQEFLSLWSELAIFAKNNLKEGGVLLAMTGNVYLPEILQRLGEHLTYQWQLACTLDGQHSEVHAAWVNNQMWKPVLVYRNGGDLVNIGSDRFANEKREKEFHEWGQGISGYIWQIEHFTKPNDLICDPFLGGGTTAIAALQSERRFIGFDIEIENVRLVKGRISKL